MNGKCLQYLAFSSQVIISAISATENMKVSHNIKEISEIRNKSSFISIYLFLTAKYNEAEEDVPDLHTLENIVKQPISNEVLLKYEMWALQKMGWKLNGILRTFRPLLYIFIFLLNVLPIS